MKTYIERDIVRSAATGFIVGILAGIVGSAFIAMHETARVRCEHSAIMLPSWPGTPDPDGFVEVRHDR